MAKRMYAAVGRDIVAVVVGGWQLQVGLRRRAGRGGCERRAGWRAAGGWEMVCSNCGQSVREFGATEQFTSVSGV
jgi:hypothetical protein